MPRPPLRWLATLLVAAPLAAPLPAQQESAPFAFALGKLLLAEGNYREALRHLRSAAEMAPEDPYVHGELAEVLYRLGQVQPALRHADEALRLAPHDADVLSMVAQLYFALGDDDAALDARAEQTLRRLLVLRPDDLQGIHSLARLLQRRGDLAGAQELFQRLVALRPGARAASSALLQILLERGEREEAVALLRDALRDSPGALEVRITLADLLAGLGEHQAVVELLRATPQEQRREPDLERRLAMALYRTGETAAAAALLDEVLADQPDPRLALLRALMRIEQGDAEQALADLEALHGSRLADSEVGLALARLLIQQGRAERAWPVLHDTLDALTAEGQQEAAARLRLELAQLLLADKRWQMALDETEQLVRHEEPSLRLAATLIQADALAQLGRGDEALASLGGRRSGRESLVVAKRAELLFGMGREAEAEKELARLGGDAEARRLAVDVYQRIGRYGESIPLLEGILREHPEATDVKFRLAAAYERSGQLPEAVATFRDLLQEQPDFHLALNYLGYLWAENGENLDEALGLVQRALELDPGNAAYVDSLGWVYYRLGEYDQALKHLRRAAALRPDDGTILEHLGDAYRALGEVEEARRAYRRALELEDPDADAEAVRRKLQEVERGNGRADPRR